MYQKSVSSTYLKIFILYQKFSNMNLSTKYTLENFRYKIEPTTTVD